MRTVDPVLNIAAYRFVTLADPHAWRDAAHAEASARSIAGTVLLAAEGINLVLAGAEEDVDAFIGWLNAQQPFAGMAFRRSWSAQVPFDKLVVKVKPEIIRMNHPMVRPQQKRAPAVDAATLKRWLDAGVDDVGRPVVTLDTRNAFEVDHGRFRGAHDWRIDRFGAFPEALKAHADDLLGKTVVSYCTGGIRCEKAALLMAEAGVENVYQLEGGILDYLAQTDGTHFEGDCFVFDRREALDAKLTAVGAS